MGVLEILFRVALLFCLAAIPILGLGIGLGYGLHAVIPGLDLNWAIVAGAVFAVGILEMMMRFVTILRETLHASGEEDEDEEEEGGEKTDEPWVVIPRKTAPLQGPGRKRRKRR